MNVMVPVPDELAARFGSEAELGRRVVEALALAEYRAGRLTRLELRQLLGFDTQSELDGFLKEHGVVGEPAAEEVVRQTQDPDRHIAADDLVAKFKAFASSRTLGGLKLKDMISEGRR